MYPGIPAVADEIVEPMLVDELEEAGVRYLFVPLLDLGFWEHQGYRRAHNVENVPMFVPNKNDPDEVLKLGLVCMYDFISWKTWLT